MPGGSSGSTTTVQKVEPWAEQRPYLIDVFRQAQALNQQPGPFYYPGATVAPMSPESDLALQARSARAFGGSPLTAAAGGHMADVLGGNYLFGNPFLSGAIDTASQGLVRNYQNAVVPGLDSTFSAAGRYGSGLHQTAHLQSQQALTEQLGNLAADMAYRNYGDERANMLRAAVTAPQMAQQDYLDIDQLAMAGAERERMQQDLINADLNRFNYEQQLPFNKLAQYQNMIQGSYGNTTTTTEPYLRNPGMGLLEGAGAGLGVASGIGGFPLGLGALLGGLLGLWR